MCKHRFILVVFFTALVLIVGYIDGRGTAKILQYDNMTAENMEINEQFGGNENAN